nr:hypothetical protein CFP56_69019 [Quercus suber]
MLNLHGYSLQPPCSAPPILTVVLDLELGDCLSRGVANGFLEKYRVEGMGMGRFRVGLLRILSRRFFQIELLGFRLHLWGGSVSACLRLSSTCFHHAAPTTIEAPAINCSYRKATLVVSPPGLITGPPHLSGLFNGLRNKKEMKKAKNL